MTSVTMAIISISSVQFVSCFTVIHNNSDYNDSFYKCSPYSYTHTHTGKLKTRVSLLKKLLSDSIQHGFTRL